MACSTSEVYGNSGFDGNELKEMKQDAILMGHDLNTQKDYIKE